MSNFKYLKEITSFTLFNFDGTPSKVTHVNTTILHILANNITENLLEVRHNILPMRCHILVIHNDS